MSLANHIVAWLNLGAFTALGVLALVQWHRRRDRASYWAAVAFGAIAVIVLAGRVLGDEGELEVRVGRILICGLVLFPYFLYRFMRTFSTHRSAFDRVVIPLTVGLVVATLVLPRFPEAGDPRPLWFKVYLAAFVVHWSLLSILVTVRLWRAGTGQVGVGRRRMRWLAIASAAFTVAILFAVAGAEEDSPVALATGLAALGSAGAFVLGLSPPAGVRFAWRRREQEQFAAAVATLMRATSEGEVAAAVLSPIARFVGAEAVILRDEDGRAIGSYGAVADHYGDEHDALCIPVDGGTLALWASPYAPYFGDEELRLVDALAALTALALDRSRLFARERQARKALERADELKSQFVALAAHELRSPVAALYGTVDTLDRLAERLNEEERGNLQRLLRTQVERLRMLTEQLLDLSRLDAEAIPVKPVPLLVRERIDAIVASVVGTRPGVSIQVDPGLEAVVDPEAFERIVSNLIGNALRYGEPPVMVSAEQRDRHFRVVVEDRGPGVSREFEPLLFERFARSGQSRERTEGTGLGLAIARSYARAHGGDLVYQPAEPRGARFELVLPRIAENS